jgi:hypothetical protein
MSSIYIIRQLSVPVMIIAVLLNGRKQIDELIPTITVLSNTISSFHNTLPSGFLEDLVVTSNPASCIIPFSRAGNLIIIRAKADTIEGNFILDTGAPGLILNSTYFRNYPITESDPATHQGGINGSVVSFGGTNILNFSFGAVNYYKIYADRIHLGHIENSKGVKILGLIGMQLFQKFEMIIDYDKSLIYLHLIGKKEARTYQSELLSDTSLYSVLPITLSDNKILTYGKVGGKKLTFLVDTGAESNVIDSRLSENVLDNVTVTRRIQLNGTGSNRVEALYGDIKNITIGNRDISSMPVLITNMEKMCFSYNRCLDGMLGFDFLSMHKIGFNFVKRKMYIWK